MKKGCSIDCRTLDGFIRNLGESAKMLLAYDAHFMRSSNHKPCTSIVSFLCLWEKVQPLLATNAHNSMGCSNHYRKHLMATMHMSIRD